MDLRCLFGFCVALLVVSPVAFAAVPVEKHGHSFRISSYAIQTPQYVSVQPRALTAIPTPASGALEQRVRFDVRAQYPGMTATVTPASGTLTFSHDGLKSSLKTQTDLMTPTRAYENVPPFRRLADAEGWGIGPNGVLQRLDGSTAPPVPGAPQWGITDLQWVSQGNFNSLIASDSFPLRRISGSMQTTTERLPGISGIDGELVPPSPPYSLSQLVACPDARGLEGLEETCLVAGMSVRPYGNSRFDFSFLFFRAYIEIDGVMWSPVRAVVNGSRTTTASRTDYDAGYIPTNAVEPPDGDEITPADMTMLIQSDFVPDPVDWPDLIDNLPPTEPVALTIDPIDLWSTPPVISESVDAVTGTRIITEETSTVATNIRGNGTDRPAIDAEVVKSTREYSDGQLVGGSDTTIDYPGAGGGSGGGPGDPGGPGGGSDPGLGGTFPDPGGSGFNETFCEYASVLCDFISWFQDEGDVGDEPDLSGIMRDPIDFERTYTISLGSSSCPPPVSINISFIDTEIEIQYDWWCQLAQNAKPFIMISAYLTAIFMTLGVVRGNG